MDDSRKLGSSNVSEFATEAKTFVCLSAKKVYKTVNPSAAWSASDGDFQAELEQINSKTALKWNFIIQLPSNLSCVDRIASFTRNGAWVRIR